MKKNIYLLAVVFMLASVLLGVGSTSAASAPAVIEGIDSSKIPEKYRTILKAKNLAGYDLTDLNLHGGSGKGDRKKGGAQSGYGNKGDRPHPKGHRPISVYVSTAGSDSTGSGGNDCRDAASPCRTIQHAIDTSSGTEARPVVIHVAAGTYSEHILMDPWESLDGGWNSDFSQQWDFESQGLEPAPEYATVIDGSGNGTCITEHSIAGANINGLTIQKGRGLAGGIYLDHSHPDISNCTITENFGSQIIEEDTRAAGGLYNYYSSPTVRHCAFRKNDSRISTALCDEYSYKLCIPACAVLNESSQAVFVDCSISQSAFDNLFEGRLGLGMVNLDSSVTIANCRFEDNVGGSRTHSPLLSFDSTVMVKDCLFSGNESGESGPSAMDFVRSTATIINTQFFDNRSIDTPTATTIYNSSSTCTIINSIFAVNTNEVAEKGCVLYNRDSECTIVNSTFADNFFYFWASGAEIRNIENSHCIIKNSIIWASNVLEGPNPSGFMSIDTDASSTLETSYSDIDQDGFEGANGNIRLDPKFVAAG